MRKDGDIVFLTDNKVLLDTVRNTPTLVCAQNTAEKKFITEEDLMRSNLASFGNDVGKVTNRATTMYDVQAQFPEDSEEYKVLEYRIMSSQKFQQDCIE